MNKRIVAAALGVTILTIPAAAVADPGHGQGHSKRPAGKKVTFVFKGIFTAWGTIDVRAGNALVRQGGFVGHQINFDLSTARVVAADRTADRKIDVGDVNNGDADRQTSPPSDDEWSPRCANGGEDASGLLIGQDCCKTQDEVDRFGGFLGNYEGNVPSFDGGCVDNPFRWCDNLDNNDREVLTFMSNAFADMTVRMVFDTKVMSASDNSSTSRSCR
jgi:hypothetical protein